MPCNRHPSATSNAGYCAACLLENALAVPRDDPSENPLVEDPAGNRAAAHLTILVPLGATPAASVFLVHAHGEPNRLLRLKTWRAPGRPDFIERFRELRKRLLDCVETPVAAPLEAFVNPAGCPSVVSEFKQGIAIVKAVESGTVSLDDALTRLHTLMEVMHRAHARNLVHGSIRSGNVLVQPDSPGCWLVDFGMVPLLRAEGDALSQAAGDLAGFDALARTLGELRQTPDTPAL